jgi:Domain of unknown function (DUF4450)
MVARFVAVAMFVSAGAAPTAGARAAGADDLPRPNLHWNIERPLRYRPEGTDFVIDDGAESFNRPLYGRHNAFRVDGGDKPEFVLYLPGRGGNLRLALRAGNSAKWLQDAAHVTMRYRPGSLLYDIRDPLLGVHGLLQLQVLSMTRTDGLILRATLSGTELQSAPVEVIAAFGGVNGERGVRDGDIGTEAVPISQWFQLRAEFCRDNVIAATAHGFELRGAAARVVGIAPPGSILTIADARQWQDIDALLASQVPADRAADVAPATSGAPSGATLRGSLSDKPPSGSAGQRVSLPVAVVRFNLARGKPALLALQRLAGGAADATELDTYRQVTAAPAASGSIRPRSIPQAVAPRRADRLLPPYTPAQLPKVFAQSQAERTAIREQIVVRTPDPTIDAAVGALNVAADAVWDERQGAVMHGAIAWRARLLGWRGAYAMDDLGWHERARRHFAVWATRQNLDPIPAVLPAAEEATHLSRNPQALHSNGDLSNSHYDMNQVYIDALFRHLLWTGDLKFARAVWPVIERHLAWERRLFRREFGPQRLPLYEAYAAIWASDDLEYHGGGVAYASAYNWWHNVMAGRVARLIGRDPAPYDREAGLIRRALAEYLWLPDEGMYAEFRDYLGLQLAHPSAGLWSFYTLLDAPGLVPERNAWLMTRYVDSQIPHLPVRGPGIADSGFFVLATTSWMPYTWSANNVVMAENVHTALGYWRAGRSEPAFRLFKSALLASMYMGICPGNVGTMNFLDVYRREAQRDFADGAGVTARAVVEGLFGIRPDALAGQIEIQPGWPAEWRKASLHTPDLDLEFRVGTAHAIGKMRGRAMATSGAADARDEVGELHFEFAARLPHVRRVHMRLPMRHEGVRRVSVNGRPITASITSDALGRRWLEIGWRLQVRNTIDIRWQGALTDESVAELDAAAGMRAGVRDWSDQSADASAASAGPDPSDSRADPTQRLRAAPTRIQSRNSGGAFNTVDLTPYFNERVTDIFRPGKYRAPRSPFVSLAIPSQGIGAWAGHVNAAASIDDSGLRHAADLHGGRFVLPDGLPFATPGGGTAPNIVFTSQWDNYPRRATVPLTGRARHVYVLMAGSTNHMQSRFDNGEVIVTYRDGSSVRLALNNPVNWWPIDQDYFIDDYQFRRNEPIPPRIDLRTGLVRVSSVAAFRGRGGAVAGGAATVLDLPLDPAKELQSLSVVAVANEVVIGLMAVTLQQ